VQHFRLEPAVQPLNIGQNELCNDAESAEEGEIIDVDTYTTGTTGQGLGLSEPMAGQPHASDINPTWTQSRLPPPGSSSGPGPGFISLNDSPQPTGNNTSQDSYFTDIQSPAATHPSHARNSVPTSSRHSTPYESEDSDISASLAMKTLQVGSRKPSHGSLGLSSPSRGRSPSLAPFSSHSGSGARTGTTSPNPAGTSSRPSSTSRKRPNDISGQATATLEQLSLTTSSMMQQLSEKRDDRAEQNSYKRARLESEVWAKDLRARSAREEREHEMRRLEQEHQHKREIMAQQLEQTKLEIELARLRREEEEARIRRIALEQNANLT